MGRRELLGLTASGALATAGCLSTPGDGGTESSAEASATRPTVSGRTMSSLEVSQSPPDSDVVETAVRVDRPATPDRPAVLAVAYEYTGTETYPRSEWGDPIPFWDVDARDSEFVLLPPPGVDATVVTGTGRDGTETGTETGTDGVETRSPLDPVVAVDPIEHPSGDCWSIEDDVIFEDRGALLELTPGTRVTRSYWVVTDPSVGCPSQGRHTHTVPRLAPTDEPWSITLTVEATD
jgi:hypothetical protein